MVVQYLHLIKEIDHQVQALQQQSGERPCPTGCYDCCRNTATMAISAVEAQHLSIGLQRLPGTIQQHILEKAKRTIAKIEQKGYSEQRVLESGIEATKLVKGKKEGDCPMLVGGVCSVYDHRPVICRVWGYPINNSDSSQNIACCQKTFIGRRSDFQPLPYARYWSGCKQQSIDLDFNHRTPNCYLVRYLLTS